MQVSCPKNNVFGIRHYPKKDSNGNGRNQQYQNLAGTQKYKKIMKIVKIYGILPKNDIKIRRMDIINDRFFAKKQFF